MDNLVVLVTCNTGIEAEIIRGKLEANDVLASVTADDAGGMYSFPFQAGFSGVQILVSAKDIIRAKNILSQEN